MASAKLRWHHYGAQLNPFPSESGGAVADIKNAVVPVVCIPGWGHSASSLDYLALALARKRPVIIVDLPGIGRNKNVAWHDFVEQLITQLPNRFFIVGWSLGGMIATSMAASYPDHIAALVTLATNPKFVQSSDWPAAMETDTYHRFCHDFTDAPEQTLKTFLSLQSLGDIHRRRVMHEMQCNHMAPDDGVKSVWEEGLALLNTLDHREFIANNSAPALHLLGENDRLVPPAVVQSIPSNTAQKTIVVPGVAHAIHLSKPEYVANTISRFFSTVAASTERDKRKVGLSFSQAATQYDNHAVLQREIAQKLIHDYVPTSLFDTCLDIGCGTGFVAEYLYGRQVKEQPHYIGVDLSMGMLAKAQNKLPHDVGHWLQGDMDTLPISTHSVATVVSNFSLQWSEHPERVIGECQRVLKQGGHFCFTTLGPQTLIELRQSWGAVDGYAHVNNFVSFDALQKILRQTGLTIKRSRVALHYLHYPDVVALMRDLKAIGAHNVNRNQNQGLTGRKRLADVANVYESRRGEQGLPATYEVYFFQCVK